MVFGVLAIITPLVSNGQCRLFGYPTDGYISRVPRLLYIQLGTRRARNQSGSQASDNYQTLTATLI